MHQSEHDCHWHPGEESWVRAEVPEMLSEMTEDERICNILESPPWARTTANERLFYGTFYKALRLGIDMFQLYIELQFQDVIDERNNKPMTGIRKVHEWEDTSRIFSTLLRLSGNSETLKKVAGPASTEQ